MNDPEEGPKRLPLRDVIQQGNTFAISPARAVQKPEGPGMPKFAPSTEVRRQHAQMTKLLAGLVADPPQAWTTGSFAALQSNAQDLLALFARNEAHYRDMDQEGRRAGSGWTGAPGARPVTTDPFTLALLDYADNLVADGKAFIGAAQKLAHDGIPGPWTEDSRWTVYERMSELYRAIDRLEGAMEGALDLANDWGQVDAAAVAWIQQTRRELGDANESVRQALAKVRGGLS
jgi:hypothetical protein